MVEVTSVRSHTDCQAVIYFILIPFKKPFAVVCDVSGLGLCLLNSLADLAC